MDSRSAVTKALIRPGEAPTKPVCPAWRWLPFKTRASLPSWVQELPDAAGPGQVLWFASCGSPGASPDASSVTLLMLCPCRWQSGNWEPLVGPGQRHEAVNEQQGKEAPRFVAIEDARHLPQSRGADSRVGPAAEGVPGREPEPLWAADSIRACLLSSAI